MRSAAWLLFTILVVSISASAQTAKEIVTHYFDAIGGVDRIKAFTSVRHTSTYIEHFPKRDTSIIRVIAKAPYSFNFRTHRHSDLVYESYGNPSGQTLYAYKPFPDKRERPRSIVSLTTSHELLAALEKHKVKRVADTTINRSSVYAVRTTSRKNNAFNRTYYFAKQNHRLVAFSSEGQQRDLNVLENYATIDSISIALTSRYFLQNKLINEIVITDFEVNPTLNDSLFIPKEYVAPVKFTLRLSNNVEFLDPPKADLDFKEFISGFNGKVVLIDLWASWCGPCKHEFTKYNDSYFHFLKTKNIQPIYISLDKPDKESDWKKSISNFALHGQHIRANKKLYQSLQKKFFGGDTMYIPRLILIDKDGTVLSPQLPNLSSGMFYTKVDELVK